MPLKHTELKRADLKRADFKRSDLPRLEDINMLVLDDSEGMQRLIGTMVEGWLRGRLYMCKNTAAAFDTLESDEFDIALVDRELTGECGLEFVRTLRARTGRNQHLPVVAMTVDPSREVMLEAILSGANSVLAKPLSIRTLSLHLARAISANPIHVPFGPLALPLSPAMARDLGPTPDGWAIIETIASSIYRRPPADDQAGGFMALDIAPQAPAPIVARPQMSQPAMSAPTRAVAPSRLLESPVENITWI